MMGTDFLDRINALKNSLCIIESLVPKADSTDFDVWKKLALLRSKVMEIQQNLSHLMEVGKVQNAWTKKQQDLLGNLNFLSQKLEYLENNLPEKFDPLLSAIEEIVISPEPVSSVNVKNIEKSNHISKTINVNPSVIVSKDTNSNGKNAPELPTVKYLLQSEFDKVPSYLRGRIQLDVVNKFVDVFNEVLWKKYSLLRIQKNKVPKTEVPLYLKWKSQNSKGNQGLKFITAEDLNTYGPSKLTKRDYTLLQILRHCKKIGGNNNNEFPVIK